MQLNQLTSTQLTVLKRALQLEHNLLELEARDNPEPAAEEYVAAKELLAIVERMGSDYCPDCGSEDKDIHLENKEYRECTGDWHFTTFGEFAPEILCEADGQHIYDMAQAVTLPNFGFAHNTDCASQWSQMQEAV